MNDDLAKQLRERVQEFYETHGAAFSSTRTFVWKEEEIIAKRIETGMTVVDVGAGNGRFARLLPEGTVYIGFEPSSALRQSADPRFDLRSGGFPHIPIPDESADVTTCFAVIQHLPTIHERQAAARELIRLTKSGGLIAVTSWHPTSEFTKRTIEPIPSADPGDLWVNWRAEITDAKRYIHDFSFEEWKTLWDHPELEIEHCGLFGKEDWTDTLEEGRNWFVIARKK
jgi:ubiquinone/menaquinone biosynthesis C-methylase UbiE